MWWRHTKHPFVKPGRTDVESDKTHIVVVEAYEGSLEFLSSEPSEQEHFYGLGLPLAELAEMVDCRITVLGWDKWYDYEEKEFRPAIPSTRPICPLKFTEQPLFYTAKQIKRLLVPTRDPSYNLSFDKKGLSPQSHGLINDNGLLFFVSCCLHEELCTLHTADPFGVVVFPMWGGIGYVAQMARATQTPGFVDAGFVVVVTDTSARRQKANQEGAWLRQAIVRRQMEDVSLALADLPLVFGDRGHEIALAGRLPESSQPVPVPRRLRSGTLEALAKAAKSPLQKHQPIHFFLYEPQEGASGVLTTLNAVTLMAEKNNRLERPLISAGPDMIFAPMKPSTFIDYWSSRGAVRHLIRDRQWSWQMDYPVIKNALPVRLYPATFAHLPAVWHEIARGSLVLLSPAVAEGLAPGQALPMEIMLPEVLSPSDLARAMTKLAVMSPLVRHEIQHQLCLQVVEAHGLDERRNRLKKTAAALTTILHDRPSPINLSRAALMFLDRRLPLRVAVENESHPIVPQSCGYKETDTFSVVVTCYEMGTMIRQAVESIWQSMRVPDEVLLVDDGSHGRETLENLAMLEEQAARDNLPLTVIRQRNRGLASARNRGLEQAAGTFISFLDGDDIIEPFFYPTALYLIRRYPRLGGVAAWASIFGAYDGLWYAPQTELPLLLVENTVIVPFLTHTALIRELGGYDTRQLYNYEDWELAVRILAAGRPIVTLPAPLMRYRIREDSLLRTMTDVQNQVLRERFFTTHKETVTRFAVEIAMQLEHRRYAEQVHLPASNSSAAKKIPGGKKLYEGIKRSFYRFWYR
jgi:glycosyltransferase involved in cell wall biosynthesis